MRYEPTPIDVAGIELPADIHALAERLAENAHDLWAQQRAHEGWVLGPQRDDQRRTHPSLVPYAQLPESEKHLDRIAALGTLKAIMALGYRIVRA